VEGEVLRSLFKYFSGSPQLYWSALFPLTYLLHIVEEYCGGEGFPSHMHRHYHIDLSETRFLVLQSLGLAAMSIGLTMASAFNFPKMMWTILAAIVVTNGAIHTCRSVANIRYEPGLITGVVLWMPLGIATFCLTIGSMSTTRLLLSVGIGLGISGLVELISMRGGRLVNG
jgi:uncharacterized protein with HXXEE motif